MYHAVERVKKNPIVFLRPRASDNTLTPNTQNISVHPVTNLFRSEVATQRCSVKKLFLKNSQNS